MMSPCLKWALAVLFLRIDVIPYLRDSFSLHLGVEKETTAFQFWLAGIQRNVNCLFPMGYGPIGQIAALVLMAGAIVLIARNKVALRKRIDWENVAIYAVPGLIPYVRYIVIRHHSWFHYFFTYRAQAATVMSLCFAIAEVMQINRKPTHTQPMLLSGR